jgi:hypothetical protein
MWPSPLGLNHASWIQVTFVSRIAVDLAADHVAVVVSGFMVNKVALFGVFICLLSSPHLL